ncbi:MAG TPA: hypothetical protein VLI69_08245 [Gammaproteobacteria bacterium]|nr:hypothetical protein [Gammaproteobacteria bacterium]
MFDLKWTVEAAELYEDLEKRAESSVRNRKKQGQTKSSKIEGLFKQIYKTIDLLKVNPRHPGLHTHPYYSIENPYHPKEKVFEAYVQNKTPGAYRVFWCYGPEQKQITILSITPHP